MRRKLMVLGVVLAVFGGGLVWDWWQQRVRTGFQDFRVSGSQDARVAVLAPYVGSGRFTVVHFWATWCAPCMVEMPNVLAGLQEIPADVKVVMVNLDKALPGDFYGKWKIDPATSNPQWVADPEQTLATAVLGKVMLPTTVIVEASPTRVIQQVGGPLSWGPLLRALR